MAARVACIGECMVELSEYPDGTLRRGFGGDTLNTAVYLARLGVPVDYVTALGDDPFSTEMLSAWQAEGVGTGLIPHVPGRVPGLYLIRTATGGERSFLYWRDSAPVRQLLHRPELPRIAAALCRAELVYLSGITLSLFDGADRDALFDILARARAAGARVAFDCNFRPRGWPDRVAARHAYDRAFRTSDIVLASVEDHALLHGTDHPDVDACAEAVLAELEGAGVAEAVVKLLQPACRVVASGTDELVTADPVDDVVDTTAAGDSFAAGYIAARRAGQDPVGAAGVGHRMAGAVVRHRGAIIPREAMPALALEPPSGPTTGLTSGAVPAVTARRRFA